MENPSSVSELKEYKKIVAIGGGHGLGRVLASLSFLGSGLTGIVATTDNGGSTGRIRDEQDCIAWGDLRNCLTQLAPKPSIGSLLFEYRFDGESELNGHNLGNLILTALDQLCIRPLEAINLIRGLLKIKPKLIPMSEEPTHLVATSACGGKVFGELNVDNMTKAPISLSLEPIVESTCEALNIIREAELILIAPGSFLTSIMPPLLIPELAKSIADSKAKVIYIDNIATEQSPAGDFTLEQKINWCNTALGENIINKAICHSENEAIGEFYNYFPLSNQFNPGLHDTKALVDALAKVAKQK